MTEQSSVLVAGATGAVGSLVVARAEAAGLAVIPHVRPRTAGRHPLGQHPGALVCDLADTAALDGAMARATSIACLVGTMRRRFAQGDTYESSDFAPIVALVESARRVPAARPRHFVLLSGYGARQGSDYLGWKWKAEQAALGSGLPCSILRPSFFDSAGSGAAPSDGQPRRPPPLVGGLVRLAGALPGLRGLSDDLRPMPLAILAAVIVRLLREGGPTGILAGRDIWRLA